LVLKGILASQKEYVTTIQVVNIGSKILSCVSSCLPVSLNGKAGITRDISATGILFEIDEDHPEGSNISFEVELNTPGGTLKLLCNAKIVRVVKEGGRSSIAAKIISQSLVSAG
jgi:hypothetical protein